MAGRGDDYGILGPMAADELTVLKQNPSLEIRGRRWCPLASGQIVSVKATSAIAGAWYIGTSVDTQLTATYQGRLKLKMGTTVTDSKDRLYAIVGWDPTGNPQVEVYQALPGALTDAKYFGTKTWGFLCMQNPFLYCGYQQGLDVATGTAKLMDAGGTKYFAYGADVSNATPEAMYHVPTGGVLAIRQLKVAVTAGTTEALTACALVVHDLYTDSARTEINIGAIAQAANWNDLTYTVSPHLIYGGLKGKLVYVTATAANTPTITLTMEADLFARWIPNWERSIQKLIRAGTGTGRTGAQS